MKINVNKSAQLISINQTAFRFQPKNAFFDRVEKDKITLLATKLMVHRLHHTYPSTLKPRIWVGSTQCFVLEKKYPFPKLRHKRELSSISFVSSQSSLRGLEREVIGRLFHLFWIGDGSSGQFKEVQERLRKRNRKRETSISSPSSSLIATQNPKQ